jgi:crotonobetainyl-CoA:carnitine CoA-transferase CaiB-like acyl-CoA transferase
MSGDSLLLQDVRLLDLSGRSAQLAARLVAELGGTVLRVEPPSGDATRRVGPWATGDPDVEQSLTFAALNSGKLSVIVDPETAGAGATLRELATSCDAVLLSDPSDWSALVDAAALVADGQPVVAVRGFREPGPYADYLAPEIVTNALGGQLFISGDPALPPCAPPEPLSQYFVSVWAALAIVAAVWAHRTKGVAAAYRLSTHEALATQEHLIRAAAMDGEPIVRNGSQHKSVAPATVFPASDGWVYIYVSRNHWEPFLRAWDPHPAEFDDPRFVPNSARRAVADRLNEAVAAWTRERPSAEIVREMQSAGVPCLRVNLPSDFIRDDQTVARELFETVRHPALGSFSQIRFPAQVDGRRPGATLPPTLGQHTDAVLRAVRGSEAES